VTSRLENLADAVFGFSITLLFIASEAPTTYVELEASMHGFNVFIFCILLLLGIWNDNNFFLYYGMRDWPMKILTILFSSCCSFASTRSNTYFPIWALLSLLD
jgi:hypothetical protein